MLIGNTVFRGAIKILEPNRIGPEYARLAVNCDLRNGALLPLRRPLPVWTVPAATKRIFAWSGKLACFAQHDVSVLRHPNNDNLLWSGAYYGSYPKQANATQFFGENSASLHQFSSRFGVDMPVNTPVVALDGTAGEKLVLSTSYRFSCVNGTGEEGPMSMASTGVDMYEGQTAHVSNFFADNLPPEDVDKVRIYRAETDAYGKVAWQFRAEVAATLLEWIDDVATSEEVAMTEGWNPPVDYSGLADIGNALVCGWKDRDLYLSEVGYPYAFPDKYAQRTDSPVVGVGVAGGYALVLTQSHPYLLSVTTPEAATMSKLQFAHACLAARSICPTRYGVLYASHDGLVQISSSGVPNVLTQDILKREQWLAYDPDEFVAAVHDDKMYLFRHGSKSGLLYDFQRKDIVDIVMDVEVDDVHADTVGDRLLLLTQDHLAGAFGEGPALRYEWWSGEYVLTGAQSFSAALIVGEQSASSPVRFTLYDAGTEVFSVDVIDSRPFRLPGKLTKSVSYKLSGRAKVLSAHLAGNIEEFGRV